MKVITGQIWFEANTFNPIKTTLDDFKQQGLYFGAEVLERLRGVGEVGGHIAAARSGRGDVTLIPTVRALAFPAGPVERTAFEYLRGRLIEGIRGAGHIDGVLLSLHGAMVADGVDDCEGNLLTEVRQVVGPAVPVVTSLDLHANVTATMIEAADIIVGYRTCPHEDIFETGYRAAKLLFRMIRGGVRPASGWRKIPMMIPAESMLTTVDGPFARLFEWIRNIEDEEGLLSASLFSVQPWLDVGEMGSAALVYTERDQPLAQRAADQLARAFWQFRFELQVEKPAVRDAIDKAMASSAPHVVLVDGSDATVGGAPGDSTIVLQTLLEMEVPQPVYLPILDPEAVQKAVRIGCGHTVTLAVGGKRDNIFSKPVTVTGKVTHLTDGRAEIEGPVMHGVTIDMGRTAVIEAGNIHIVLTERNYPGHDPSLYRAAGLEPEQAKILVAKSAAHYRSNYAHITTHSVLADTMGLCTSNFARLPYKEVPRPLFPLDKDFEFVCSSGEGKRP